MPQNLWNFKVKFENEHLLCLLGLMTSQKPKIVFLGGLNSVFIPRGCSSGWLHQRMVLFSCISYTEKKSN